MDLGSFQVFGIATDLKQSELMNASRPVLVKPVVPFSATENQKLLQIEFETKPLDLPIDYRIKIASQSLEIKYNAVRNILSISKILVFFSQQSINYQLVSNKILNVIFKGKNENFEFLKERFVYSVKQAAYSTYTDVKNRSYILMKHNVESIKSLDVDIDLQSAYFLLPQNGVYQE
jgi:hypothetical protein